MLCVNGSSARQTEQTDKRPVDMAIVGIVDEAEMDGVKCYKKYGQGEESALSREPEPEEEDSPEDEEKKTAGFFPEKQKTRNEAARKTEIIIIDYSI